MTPFACLQAPPVAAGWSPEDRILSADVVVVGAGPGGAAVALQLALAGADVLVLEEGPSQSRFRLNQANTARFHMQEAGSMVAQGPTPFLVAAGRGVGGGSLINSALCFRTPRDVLQGWEDVVGDDRYSPEKLDPVFRWLEENLQIGPARNDHVAGVHNLKIVQGATEMGLIAGLASRNTPACIGCGACNFGCPSNGKASVNLNLLPEACKLGARIQAETRVSEFLMEGDRVVGVRGRMHDPETGVAGGQLTVNADKVVLSCGAIGTPRLLHFSGLAERMTGVGEGLHVHPGSAVLARYPEPVYMWKGATQGSWFESPEHPGVLPHAFTAPPEVVALLLAPMVGGMKPAMAQLDYIGGILALVSDKGEGTVKAFPDGRAWITYDFADGDVDRMKESMILCAEVQLKAGATTLYGVAHGIGAHDNLDDFAAAMRSRQIRDFILYSSHPMSSVRMGRALDAGGKAIGVEGLWVADASVFPTSLGVNPQLSTMAVSTLIGQGIR
jgi:choline dehydrogenase-like flavoprotein